jgi:hypothetical protein
LKEQCTTWTFLLKLLEGRTIVSEETTEALILGRKTFLLGIPFRIDMLLKAPWDWILNKLEGKIHRWASYSIPLASRIMIRDEILVASHVFYSSSLFSQ